MLVVEGKGCVSGESSGRRQDEGYGQVGKQCQPSVPRRHRPYDDFVQQHRTRAGTLADSNSRVINAKTKTEQGGNAGWEKKEAIRKREENGAETRAKALTAGVFGCQ